MKKKILFCCLLGAPIGLAISTIVTILISLAVSDGMFYPVVPELVADCGGELNAVMLQALCSLLYGAAWAGASLIFQREDWNLLRQTVLHLLICSLATFPIAYLTRWMHHSLGGVLLYFGTFLVLYGFVWFAQYATMKRRVRQINRGVEEKRREN